MVFVFDENISHWIASALDILEDGHSIGNDKNKVWDINKLGKHLNFPKPESSYNDSEVIQIAGEVKGTIFTFDDDFKRIKHLSGVLQEHKVGVVYFKTSVYTRGYWNMVLTILKNWEEIKSKIHGIQPPFCFVVNKNGISKYDF